MEKLDKFCIGFNLDTDTQKLLREMHLFMYKEYPNNIKNPHINQDGNLPFHMTIIGGIKIDSNLSSAYMGQVLTQLKHFEKGASMPVLEDIKPARLYGNILGVRLKFKAGSYVITGVPEKNIALAKMLGVLGFNFDATHHISLCSVWGEYKGMDKVWPRFVESIALKKRELLNLKLTPCVWKKGKDAWTEY